MQRLSWECRREAAIAGPAAGGREETNHEELGAVRQALEAGELDGALARLTGGDPRRPAAGGAGAGRLPADLRGGGGHPRHPLLRPRPHRDLRQPHRPPARPGAGRVGERGLPGLRRPQRHGHHPLPVGGLAPGGGGLDGKGPRPEENETTASLVRGMAELAARRGYPVAGFDAYAVSDVLPGSGLSSSAACEVLLGVIENHLFCRDASPPWRSPRWARGRRTPTSASPAG